MASGKVTFILFHGSPRQISLVSSCHWFDSHTLKSSQDYISIPRGLYELGAMEVYLPACAMIPFHMRPGSALKDSVLMVL
mmetsp:Transcript_54953/g.159600  ORF Transcript_54953/g.159600 Transcript_54953/m.159600 type:complete len:80 (+) Transcript_54953:158-397(+)